MDNNKRIIEINGIKLEVDLSQARVVENYRIGDNVKLLKKRYSDMWENRAGVIVGFDNFKERPTIIVAYLESSGYSAEIKFEHINKDTKEVEICPMNPSEKVLQKETVIDSFDRQIAAKEKELVDIKTQKSFFLNKFGQYFEAGKKVENILRG